MIDKDKLEHNNLIALIEDLEKNISQTNRSEVNIFVAKVLDFVKVITLAYSKVKDTVKNPFKSVVKKLVRELEKTIVKALKKEVKIYASIFALIVMLFVFFVVLWFSFAVYLAAIFHHNGFSIPSSILYSIFIQLGIFMLSSVVILILYKKSKLSKLVELKNKLDIEK